MRLRLPIRTRQFFAATIEEYADRFDTDARQALTVAEEEASRLGHGYVGTEHLLLGLLRVPDNTAQRAIGVLGLSPERVREAVEYILGPGRVRGTSASRLTPRAMKTIALAARDAKREKAAEVGTEHLLLGLLRERESIAAGVLESLDANERRVRAALAHIKYGAAAPEPLVMRSHRPGRADPAARHLEHAQRTIAWSADVAQRSGNLARAERLRRLADELQALINEGQHALDDDDQASGEEA
jgi:ATP-dependent Clp protease ATP-binding subunit ClpA